MTKADCPAALWKHSSGDLQSRLKTRKVLGVGEIDDGDVHRSKISQILGHSEHLYRKLPRGLWMWQVAEAVMFTLSALLALFFPSALYDFFFVARIEHEGTLAMRYYSAALFSLGIMWWNIMGNNDRAVIRMCLLTSVIYYCIQILASILSFRQLSTPAWRIILSVLLRIVFAAISASFYHALDHPGYRPLSQRILGAAADGLSAIPRTPSREEATPTATTAATSSAPATGSADNEKKTN